MPEPRAVKASGDELMETLTPKERLLRVLRGEKEKVDRPPVICVGGMMNAAVVEIMERTGHRLPEGHQDEGLMVQIALDVHEQTGFENFGLPFCMTVEAEGAGSAVSLGSLSCEPKIEKEAYPCVSDVEMRDIQAVVRSGRIPVVLGAIERLSKSHPHIPVIGTLTGPISLAASLVDPVTFYKELRTKKKRSHEVLDYVSDLLGTFAELLVEHGAAVVAIGDPSATGEILGPRTFKEYEVKYVNRIADRVHIAGAPLILHICGHLNSVKHLLPELRVEAISTDALVSLPRLKEEHPELVTMGNVSTYLLEFGDAEKVARTTARLVEEGVDIIAPACGLSTSTPLRLIRALTEAVKERPRRG
jgi:[methyl-Co(III) methanol-specific corrinoid protein]:coenzyme M methyltransferase